MMSRCTVKLDTVIVIIMAGEQEGSAVDAGCGNGIIKNTENRINLGAKWD